MNVAILNYVFSEGGVAVFAALVAVYIIARFRRSRRRTIKVRIVV